MQSRNTPKKPLKFKFDKYKDEQTCYGLKRLNFSNSVKDPSFLREKLAYELAGKYMPASRAAYAKIRIDGVLLGLYVQVEQVDKTFLKRHFDDNGFNLYKAADNGGSLQYRGPDQSQYESEYDLKTNETENDWSRLVVMIDKLGNTPAAVFTDTIRKHLYLDRCIRHLAFSMVLSHFDSYTGSGRNFYLYDDIAGEGFSILLWDLKEAFGAYTNNWDVISQDVIGISDIDRKPLLKRILDNDSLKQVYLRYIRDMIEGAAASDSIAARADHLTMLIDAAVQADLHKLYSYQNFLDNIEREVVVGIGMRIPGIKQFSRQRNANLLAQLGMYTGLEAGTPVPLPYDLHLTNYPNPFSGITGIRYELQERSSVNIVITNVLGTVVFAKAEQNLMPGYHETGFDGSTLPAGVYFCRISVNHFSTGDVRTEVGLLLLQR